MSFVNLRVRSGPNRFHTVVRGLYSFKGAQDSRFSSLSFIECLLCRSRKVSINHIVPKPMLWHAVDRRPLRSLLVSALAVSQVVGIVSAIEPTISLYARTRPDPVSLSIHTLETRSPADNTTFGAGISTVALSENRQLVYFYSLLCWKLQSSIQIVLYSYPSWWNQFSSCLGHSLL